MKSEKSPNGPTSQQKYNFIPFKNGTKYACIVPTCEYWVNMKKNYLVFGVSDSLILRSNIDTLICIEIEYIARRFFPFSDRKSAEDVDIPNNQFSIKLFKLS